MIKKIISVLISVAAWLLIWQIGALIVDNPAFFAGVGATLKALARLAATLTFWKTVFLSMVRIILGFIIGVLIGILLAFICSKLKILYSFFSIGFGVIKSTPVASIIMILWIIIGGARVASAIAVFMVAPIIWQNLIDGYNAVDKNLAEVTDVFDVTGFKRFKLLIFPTLLRYFVPAALTSIGLAWKSGIAAEIITVAKNSIGYEIKTHKDFFESDEMFAWTLVVVVISVIFETIIRYSVRRFKNYES